MENQTEVLDQVERICKLYPLRTTPEYIKALTAELWAKYGSLSSTRWRRLVNEALTLTEFPPTLATFATASAAIRKRWRDLSRDAAGKIIDIDYRPEDWQ